MSAHLGSRTLAVPAEWRHRGASKTVDAIVADSGRRERRRAQRRAPDPQEALARVRLRAGRELDVVDISDSGVLVDGVTRLHPGAHVDVHVMTREGRVLVRSRVVRAFVSHVQADAIRYGGALEFEPTI